MADQQIETLRSLGLVVSTLATGDDFVVNDISDTTDDAGGTAKVTNAATIASFVLAIGQTVAGSPTNDGILHVDGSGNLATDANCKWDGTAIVVGSGGTDIVGDFKGAVRIVYNGAARTTAYHLSLQHATSKSVWFEILNKDSLVNQGVFFGMNGTDFQLWNYQGGSITWFTDTVASSGVNRVRLANNGLIGINKATPALGMVDLVCSQDIPAWHIKLAAAHSASAVKIVDSSNNERLNIKANGTFESLVNANGEGLIRLKNASSNTAAWAGFELDNDTGVMGYTWVGSSAYTADTTAQNNITLEAVNSLYLKASNGTVFVRKGTTNLAQFDNNATAGNTRFLLYDVNTSSLKRVKVGANGTGPGGVGRALYLDNV